MTDKEIQTLLNKKYSKLVEQIKTCSSSCKSCAKIMLNIESNGS